MFRWFIPSARVVPTFRWFCPLDDWQLVQNLPGKERVVSRLETALSMSAGGGARGARASRCVRVCADAECVGEGWGEGWARAVLVAGAGDDEHDVVHAADDTHEGGRLVLLLVELLRRPAAAS